MNPTKASDEASVPLPDRAPGIGDGSAVPVTERILWLRMPLAGPLGFINVWAMADREGWTIVDTGLGDEATEAAWRAALAGPLATAPVRRVLVTHGHPDHIGCAGWLVRHCRAEFVATREEYLACRAALEPEGPNGFAASQHAAGCSPQQIDDYRARMEDHRALYRPLPPRHRRMRDGDRIGIGAREWQIICCGGHSPEHAALYCATPGILVSGDQILPHMIANIAAPCFETGGDPLGEWLSGLGRLRDIVPDEILVLPSHGDPFRDLHARIAETEAHNLGMIARVEAGLDRPCRAIDLLEAAMQRPPKPRNIGAWTAEVLACLDWLAARGRAEARPDDAGVLWWRRPVRSP